MSSVSLHVFPFFSTVFSVMAYSIYSAFQQTYGVQGEIPTVDLERRPKKLYCKDKWHYI